MEGKNVVYLVALIVTCLFVVLVLAYIPNLKDAFQNADQSSNLINHIENNIDYDSTNDNNQSLPVLKKIDKPVENPKTAVNHIQYQKQKIENIQKQTAKPLDLSNINEQLNNPKDFIDYKDIVNQSLESLVTPRNESINESEVDSSRPFMEFNVPNDLSINQRS